MKNWRLPRIDTQKCILCGDCVEICPHKVLEIHKGKMVFADAQACVYCATCESVCLHYAITCDYEIVWA